MRAALPPYCLAIAALIAAAGFSSSASAQASNRPFAFAGGSSGFGGPSPAYKQLMLEQKIFGRPAQNNTFTRDLNGNLVNVRRHRGVAYRLTDSGAVLPPSAGRSFFTTDLSGFAGAGMPLALQRGPAKANASPINDWVGQLYATAPLDDQQ